MFRKLTATTHSHQCRVGGQEMHANNLSQQGQAIDVHSPPTLPCTVADAIVTYTACCSRKQSQWALSYPPPYPSTLLRIAVLTHVVVQAAPKKGERFTRLNTQAWISAGRFNASQVRVTAKTTTNMRSTALHRMMKHQLSCTKLSSKVQQAIQPEAQLKCNTTSA